MKQLATVTAVGVGRAILIVADGATKPLPATVEDRGDGWIPAVNRRVLVEQASDGRLYVTGGV